MNKRKIVQVSTLIGVLIFLSIYISSYIHFFLSNNMQSFSLNTLYLIESIKTHENQRQIFFALCVLGSVFVFYVFCFNDKSYYSDLDTITPDIKTPKAVGQFQNGSARWMTEKEKEECFDYYQIDKNNPIIKKLMKSGYDDLDFVDTKIKSKEAGEEVVCDKETNYLKKGGAVVGSIIKKGVRKVLYVGTDTHTIEIGSTRVGKTRCGVLQTIITLALKGGNMVIGDMKGELNQYTKRLLEKLGYDVWIIDFKTPAKSHKYNLLQPIIEAYAEDDFDRAINLAWDLTASLVGEPEGEKIWTNGEASIIAGSILCIVADNMDKPQYQNMANVYFFISEMCTPIGPYLPLEEYLAKKSDDFIAKMVMKISSIAPSKTRSSFYTSALTTLRLFTTNSINSMTKSCDFTFEKLGEKKQAIFMVLPDEKSTYYSIATLMITQMYEIIVRLADNRGGRLETSVDFVLDEFGNFTAIPDFDKKITVAGGRNIHFHLYLQSFPQLNNVYGDNIAKIIRGNCETMIYLYSDDPDTRKEVSEKLDNYTTSSYQTSASYSKYQNTNISHSNSLIARPLLTVSEVGLIKRPYQLVTSRNHPAMMTCDDISKWEYNAMLGLGDEEHNRMVRETREKNKPILNKVNDKIEYWDRVNYYKSLVIAKIIAQQNKNKGA